MTDPAKHAWPFSFSQPSSNHSTPTLSKMPFPYDSSPASPHVAAQSPPVTPFYQHLSVDTQSFDPFDTEDMDNLSTLLSRELLEDVESASSLPSPQPPAKSLSNSTSPSLSGQHGNGCHGNQSNQGNQGNQQNGSTTTSSSTRSTTSLGASPAQNNANLPPSSAPRALSLTHPYSPIISTMKDTSSSLTTGWSNHRLDTTTWTYPPRNVTTVTAANSAAHPTTPTASSPLAATDKDANWARFDPYSSEAEFDPTLPLPQNHQMHQMHQNQPVSVEIDPNHTAHLVQKLAAMFPQFNAQQLEHTLAENEYDLERAVDELATVAATPPGAYRTQQQQQQQQQQQHYLSPRLRADRSSPVASPPSGLRKRQVCRHYLAGECYRRDCWFSHDLEVKPCKFWLQGSCLKGDTCEFAHSIQDLGTHANDLDQHLAISAQQPTVADFAVVIGKSSRKRKNKKTKK